MAQHLLILATTWSLIGAPAFCRAGVLSQCCQHSSPSTTYSKGEQCHEKDCCSSEDLPTDPQPENRECGECAAVCSALVKPCDELTPIDLAGEALAICVWLPEPITRTAVPVGHNPLPHPRLPFPFSDIPLLI